jgi:hypothetical protein
MLSAAIRQTHTLETQAWDLLPYTLIPECLAFDHIAREQTRIILRTVVKLHSKFLFHPVLRALPQENLSSFMVLLTNKPRPAPFLPKADRE